MCMLGSKWERIDKENWDDDINVPGVEVPDYITRKPSALPRHYNWEPLTDEVIESEIPSHKIYTLWNAEKYFKEYSEKNCDHHEEGTCEHYKAYNNSPENGNRDQKQSGW